MSSTSLTQSVSSAKLNELEASIVANTGNIVPLQHLVKLDSDIRLVIKELPVVWKLAWEHLEICGKNNNAAFQGNVVKKRRRKTPINFSLLPSYYIFRCI